MELAELGGESLRRGRAHPTAPGPQLAPACPILGSPVPSHGPGIGKMGGVMEKLGVGRAKLRIPGSGVQHGTGFGEASRGGAESGWGLSAPGGAELGRRWQPSEVPDCQWAEFHVWCGKALGRRHVSAGGGVWVNGNRGGVGSTAQRPFFFLLGETDNGAIE